MGCDFASPAPAAASNTANLCDVPFKRLLMQLRVTAGVEGFGI